MAFSSWLCTNNTKTMFVKIVHPGGHVELHDRPVLAAEIMLQNPRCCVAYPHIFQQPSAIVPPDTTLMPGQKFYVVPISTIKKLRLKISTPLVRRHHQHAEEPNSMKNACWFFGSKNTRKVNSYRRESSSGAEDNCFAGLLTGITIRARNDGPAKDAAVSSSSRSSETRMLTTTSKKNDDEESPKRLGSFHGWQPTLEIISEE